MGIAEEIKKTKQKLKELECELENQSISERGIALGKCYKCNDHVTVKVIKINGSEVRVLYVMVSDDSCFIGIIGKYDISLNAVEITSKTFNFHHDRISMILQNKHNCSKSF